jgi:hypothetical protein
MTGNNQLQSHKPRQQAKGSIQTGGMSQGTDCRRPHQDS